METSSFWSCHIWVAAATPCKLKQSWGGKRNKPPLSEGWPHGGVEVLPWWCQRPSPHHMEGHHTPIQHSKCACKFQCQRALHAGPCAHGTDARSQVALSSDTNSDLQTITPGFLQGTYLSSWKASAFSWAHFVHSLMFCTNFEVVGAVVVHGTKPSVTSIGRQGCLLYMR